MHCHCGVCTQRENPQGTWAWTTFLPALASATYDAANRITSRVTQTGATTLTFDHNGNLTNDGTFTYSWNSRNQLTGLSGGASVSFQYDGLGRRRAKTINGTTTQFLYDGLNFVQELASGKPTANLLTGLGLDETFTRTLAGGQNRTLLTDALGSTLALANGSGAVQTEYTYSPFGEWSVTGSGNTNAQLYTGREGDTAGLQYSRARYYSPVLQRFISEDPIGPAGGVNLYAYAANAPTRCIDPFGLKPGPGFGGWPDRRASGGGRGRGSGRGRGAGLGSTGGPGAGAGDGNGSDSASDAGGDDKPGRPKNCGQNLPKLPEPYNSYKKVTQELEHLATAASVTMGGTVVMVSAYGATAVATASGPAAWPLIPITAAVGVAGYGMALWGTDMYVNEVNAMAGTNIPGPADVLPLPRLPHCR